MTYQPGLAEGETPDFRTFLGLTERTASGDREARDTLMFEAAKLAINAAAQQNKPELSRLAAMLARSRQTITPPKTPGEEDAYQVLNSWISLANKSHSHLEGIEHANEVRERHAERARRWLTDPEYTGDY